MLNLQLFVCYEAAFPGTQYSSWGLPKFENDVYIVKIKHGNDDKSSN